MVADHIRATIGQLEMHEKLPTDRRNFDSSSKNEVQLQRISDTGSLSYGGVSGEPGFDVGNISYKRPSNRKNNEIMSRYDFDDSGSAASSGPLRSCHHFHKSIKSKCNYTVIIIILGIICVLQLTVLICLTVKLGSSDDNEPETSRRSSASNRGRSLTKVMSRNAEPGQVIFSDDFEQFDESVWRHDQYLTTDGFVLYGSSPNNSYVEDGMLYIRPTFTIDQFNESYLNYGKLVVGKTIDNRCTSFYRTQCEKIAGGGYRILNPIMSASIRTSQSFAFQYGVLEFRAKMPAGDWISTEISLMPRYEFYGEPADTAKIVLITTRGNMDYYSTNQTHFGQERFCSQLIYSDLQSSVRSSMVQYCINSEPGYGFGVEFHTYKFDWNPDMLKVFLDDRLVGKFIANTVMPPGVRHIVVPGDHDEEHGTSSFDQQFYINMKVGVGVGFPDVGMSARSGKTKPWKNDVPEAPYRFWMSRKTWENSWYNRSAALQVDYIRVRAL